MTERHGEVTMNSEISSHDVQKLEEAKLKAKYPGSPRRSISGQTAFLQKHLNKGQKYFDSGDYQMAKQKMEGVTKQPLKVPVTGDVIPTPDTVPAKKTSIIQTNKFPPNAN